MYRLALKIIFHAFSFTFNFNCDVGGGGTLIRVHTHTQTFLWGVSVYYLAYTNWHIRLSCIGKSTDRYIRLVSKMIAIQEM